MMSANRKRILIGTTKGAIVNAANRIFENSLNCIETLNGAVVDSDAARFQWHIGLSSPITSSSTRSRLKLPGGHAAFQAIMHVLSELRNPLFQTPLRQRALRAIQLSRKLKENNNTKPWLAVKNMIDRVVGQNPISPDDLSDDSSPQSSVPGACRTPPPSTSRLNPPIAGQVPVYPTQSLGSDPMPQPLQQDTLQFNWDDLNFNTIVGGTQGSAELPEFDFVSWPGINDVSMLTAV